MSRHLFLSPRGDTSGRWRKAFPAAEVLQRAPAGALHRGDVVWVSDEIADALAVVAGLAARNPEASVVVLSLDPQETAALQAFGAGARGYCHAWSAPSLLQQVAVVVANGGMWIGAELMSRVVAATRKALPAEASPDESLLSALTEREREVALEVAKGLTNKEVARQLGITERTVKAHLGAIFDKLGTRDRLQLVLRLSAAKEALPEGA